MQVLELLLVFELELKLMLVLELLCTGCVGLWQLTTGLAISLNDVNLVP